MNIPSNYPSPDQENVYYSVSSLRDKLSSYFESSVVSEILVALQEFKLPVFVLDDSNSPNSYLITIYPRNGNVQTRMINNVGSIVQSIKAPPVVPSKVESKITDGGSSIVLDKSFHSTNSIRDNEYTLELSADEDQLKTLEDAPYEMELLLSTKYIHEPSLIKERSRYLAIAKNIVADQLRNMPNTEYEKLVQEYNSINSEIDSILSLLKDAEIGKKDSVDSLNFQKSAREIFSEAYDGDGVHVTRLQVAQSLSSLANILHGDKLLVPEKLAAKTNTNLQDNVHFDDSYQTAWNRFLLAMEKNEKIQLDSSDIASKGQINTLSGSLGDVLRFSYQSTTKETFSNHGWLKEWYLSNFLKKIQSQDPMFDSLDAFLDLYRDTVDAASQRANLYATKGNGILVYQAILKAIVELCQSNLDVTEHAPRDHKDSIFDICNRSPVLGPVGCHPYPSRTSELNLGEDGKVGGGDDIEKLILNYSKPGFLCYGALLQISKKIFGDNKSTSFVKSNMKKFDSDHDKVINLWETVTDYKITKKYARAQSFTANLFDEFRTVDVAHLYKLNEEFSNQHMWIIGKGDNRFSSQERSFINWHMPTCQAPLHSKTHMNFYKKWDLPEYDSSKITTASKMYLRGKTVTIEPDKVQLSRLDNPLKAAGYRKISGNQGTKFSRTKRVHYGIYDPELWTTSEAKNGQIKEFYLSYKSGNVIYFWASIVSLYKAICVETYRNLITSLEEIMDTDIEISYDEIESMMDVDSMFEAIKLVLENLSDFQDLDAALLVGPDGAISVGEIFNSNYELAETKINRDERFWNTTGSSAVKMLNDYTNLVSLISPDNSISIVEEMDVMLFDHTTYLPPESFQSNANSNWTFNHGGKDNYISPEFNSYRNVLQFTQKEIQKRKPMKKNLLATNSLFSMETPFQLYLDNLSYIYLYKDFLNSILGSLENFKSFVEGITISEKVKEVYNDGHFDPSTNLDDPSLLISQVDRNRKKLGSDFDGVSKFYKQIKIEDTLEKFNNHYLYVVGLRSNAWENKNSTVVLYPEYIDANQELISKFEFGYFEPNYGEELSESELVSKEILDYLHLCRGINITPSTFSDKNDLVYSENVIKNASEVFPWKEDDFEDGVPKESLDSIFNMSPHVFPRNYFYDVCLSNKYHRIVGVYLSPDDLRAAGFENEFIGSIRWRIGEKDG
tara:strand:- start:407 stop:3958 length:3552 start_codon:yes stop_codon:yes gene_type:complete